MDIKKFHLSFSILKDVEKTLGYSKRFAWIFQAFLFAGNLLFLVETLMHKLFVK